MSGGLLARLKRNMEPPPAAGGVREDTAAFGDDAPLPADEGGRNGLGDGVPSPPPGPSLRTRGAGSNKSPWHANAGEAYGALLAEIQERVLVERPDLIRRAYGGKGGTGGLTTYIEGTLARRGIGRSSGERRKTAATMAADLAGFGPLEPLMDDPKVSEIMINGPRRVYVEKEGRLAPTGVTFRHRDHVVQLVQRIIAPLGRRLDTGQPYVDARLPDGSRLHAIIEPVAVDGPTVTIRRFGTAALTGEDLIGLGSMTEEMHGLLRRAVRQRFSVLVSGGTSSGKTTLLNILSAFIPDGAERIITIEEAAELQLAQEHVARLEARPPNAEGSGEVTLRTLVRNALRMRPDRIIIGEVRGAEAFDLLQALNTGHKGSMSTIHANSCSDALTRLENMVLMAPEQLPHTVVERQVTDAIDLVVHAERLPGGRRVIAEIAAVAAGQGPWGGGGAPGHFGSPAGPGAAPGSWSGRAVIPLFVYRQDPGGGSGTEEGGAPGFGHSAVPEGWRQLEEFMPAVFARLSSPGAGRAEGGGGV